ncbi:MAG TPA: RDD family protein [Thiohalobacter sp.]|nr:RDD family protein [Thiohalobacter sp.]
MHPVDADLPRAGLLRRLAAILYDSLLAGAVLFLAAALALPLTGGEAVAAGNPVFTAYLFLVLFLFFAWFWIHGGQTLGMRAWRLRVQTRDGRPISWGQAMLRYLMAWASLLAAGAGYLWLLLDRERSTWHDRFSDSVIVVLPKRR